jgi:hypothetical protein
LTRYAGAISKKSQNDINDLATISLYGLEDRRPRRLVLRSPGQSDRLAGAFLAAVKKAPSAQFDNAPFSLQSSRYCSIDLPTVHKNLTPCDGAEL